MKRRQLPEFCRSENTHPVTLADGQQMQVANQLKRGIGQVYWYYLQFPCGGWVEFDIRAFEEIDEADFLNQSCRHGATMLPEVAEILRSKTLAEIKAVA